MMKIDARAGTKRRRTNGKSKFVRRKFMAPRTVVYVQPSGELKFHDLDINVNPIAAAGGIIIDSVNKISQGVTESERIGRKCRIKSINWRWDLLLPGTATRAETSDVVRILLYLDKQANGATATVTGILESADFQSFNNLSNKGRFRTLMDRTYNLSASAGSGRGTTDTLDYGEFTLQDSTFLKVNIPVEFSGTTGAIGEIRSNNIGVLAIGKAGYTIFSSKMRLRFSDGG